MMQLFGRKTAPVDVFREVLFDQSLAFLRLIPGEESVLEMVRPSSQPSLQIWRLQ